jgi:hypothetical protein
MPPAGVIAGGAHMGKGVRKDETLFRTNAFECTFESIEQISCFVKNPFENPPRITSGCVPFTIDSPARVKHHIAASALKLKYGIIDVWSVGARHVVPPTHACINLEISGF